MNNLIFWDMTPRYMVKAVISQKTIIVHGHNFENLISSAVMGYVWTILVCHFDIQPR
jgi:hypothetical protein